MVAVSKPLIHSLLHDRQTTRGLKCLCSTLPYDHDLVTDRRIAEFKFIDWRPARNTIRENVLFAVGPPDA